MLLIDILRIISVLTGVMLFGINLSSLARRKMTESFSITWGVVAVIMILGGIFLRPYGLANMISLAGLIMIVIIAYCTIFGTFYVTEKVSEVTRKNQELAIQLSLANQENRMMMQKLQEIEEALQKEKADNE